MLREDKDVDVRIAAVHSLGRMGKSRTHAAPIVTTLAAALKAELEKAQQAVA